MEIRRSLPKVIWLKLAAVEIFLTGMLLIAFTNWTVSNRALEFAKSKQELTDFDHFANALNSMNGGSAIEKRELTTNELSDIDKFDRLNKISFSLFIALLMTVVLTGFILVIKRNKITLNAPGTPLFMLIISWSVIIASYFVFDYWEQQKIGSGDLFSGYGFNPTIYFSIIWISKNIFTGLSFYLNRKNETAKNYHLLKGLCITDLVLGNLIILFVHDSVADCYPILDLRMSWG